MPEAVPDPQVQTPPATPPQADATPPVEQPSKYVQKALELGFQDVKDETDAFERLASAYEQQKAQNAQFSVQLQEAIAEVRSQLPPPAAPQQPQKWWNPPQADLALAARYRNPDGSWKEGTPPDLRKSVEDLEQYRDSFARKLVADPESALDPLLEKKFEQYFQKRYGQLTSEQQLQQELNSNAAWLFEKDPLTGQPNQRKLSVEGQRFNELMVEVEQDIPDKLKAFRWALKLRAAEQAATKSKQPTAEEIERINQEKKLGLLNAATPGLNRGASLPPAGSPPAKTNRNLTPGQLLAQEMHKNGTFA